MHSINDERAACKDCGVFYKEIYFDGEDGADIVIWREGVDIYIQECAESIISPDLVPIDLAHVDKVARRIVTALKEAKRDAETVRAFLAERSTTC